MELSVSTHILTSPWIARKKNFFWVCPSLSITTPTTALSNEKHRSVCNFTFVISRSVTFSSSFPFRTLMQNSRGLVVNTNYTSPFPPSPTSRFPVEKHLPRRTSFVYKTSSEDSKYWL